MIANQEPKLPASACNTFGDIIVWQAMRGQIRLDKKAVQAFKTGIAMLFVTAARLPVAMAFRHGGSTIAGCELIVRKAILRHFLAVRRAGK